VSAPEPPPRPRGATRRDAPLWRQAVEGIGLVVVLSAVVLVGGALLAIAVSLLF
jgi:hypothetical protein